MTHNTPSRNTFAFVSWSAEFSSVCTSAFLYNR